LLDRLLLRPEIRSARQYRARDFIRAMPLLDRSNSTWQRMVVLCSLTHVLAEARCLSASESLHPCLGMCNRTRSAQCSPHSVDRAACERSYMVDGAIALPCLWTSCGCLADGDGLLECPDLAGLCQHAPTPTPPPTTCGGLCGRTETELCSRYAADSSACQLSYMLDGDLALPCTWTACGCIADGDHMLLCPLLADRCRAPAPSPVQPSPECSEVCSKENLSLRFRNWTVVEGKYAALCSFYEHRADLCERSFLQTDGFEDGSAVPCMWSGGSCVAGAAVTCQCEHL
jgi:hypothetical protein